MNLRGISQSLLLALPLSLVACGGASKEPETPEERVEADSKAMENLNEDSMSGAEGEAEKLEDDMQEAESEMAAEPDADE